MTKEQRFGSIRFIHGDNKGRYPYCNSIYIEDAGIIIDPSSNRQILSEICRKDKVKTVWLTHWHEDHLMHLDLFDHVPLWMHEADAPPLSGLNTFTEWYGYGKEHQHIIDTWLPVMKEQFHYIPRKPDRYLHDRELIDLENFTVEVIHSPGHTPGSLSFYFKEPRILFLGDYDLSSFGPFYGDIHSDIDQIINSINRLREIPAKIWLSSHETGIFKSDPGELWDNYLAVIQNRESKLIDLLKQPRTIQEIAGSWIIYGKPPKAITNSAD